MFLVIGAVDTGWCFVAAGVVATDDPDVYIIARRLRYHHSKSCLSYRCGRYFVHTRVIAIIIGSDIDEKPEDRHAVYINLYSISYTRRAFRIGMTDISCIREE